MTPKEVTEEDPMTHNKVAVQTAAAATVEPQVEEPPPASETVEPEKLAATDQPTTQEVVPEEKGETGGDTGEQPESRAAEKVARRELSISVRSLVVGAVVAALVVAVGVLTWLFVGAEGEVAAQARQSANTAHAEKVALDYATNAAAMNFQDLDGWKAKLVAGTSPDLKDRLSKAADQMKQILVPLQWNSTAQPLAAKVRSVNGGIYDVDSFVSVQTKTVQGPDPLQSTATYRITIDSNNGWQITDVGGIGAAVREK
jgi:Mce-associated membrane protein